MKISRRRFSQLLSGLLLSPLVKRAEASPEVQPEVQPEAPPALRPPFTQFEGEPPISFGGDSDFIGIAMEDGKAGDIVRISLGGTAAAPGPLFVKA